MMRLRMKIADWLHALAFVIDVPDGSPFGDLYWDNGVYGEFYYEDWPEAGLLAALRDRGYAGGDRAA